MQTGSHLNSFDVQSPACINIYAFKVISRKYCELSFRCKKHRTSGPAVLSCSWKPGSTVFLLEGTLW